MRLITEEYKKKKFKLISILFHYEIYLYYGSGSQALNVKEKKKRNDKFQLISLFSRKYTGITDMGLITKI